MTPLDPPAARAVAIERRTTTGQVLEQLRQRILSGDLAEGTLLRQEKLALELGVSRVPVREALHQLQAEGLVTLTAHRGATVSRLSLPDLEEMYEIRAQLESWLLEQSMPRLQEVDFREAEALLTSMADDSNNEHWSTLNWKFHTALYRRADRPRTLDLLQKLYLNAYRHLPLPVRFAGGRERMRDEHKHLLDLCRRGDLQRAKGHLQQHILVGARDLIDRLRALRGEAVN